MINKLLTTTTVLLFLAASSVVGQVKSDNLSIGYMNPQQVMSEVPERAQIENELSSFVEQRRNQLQQKQSEFQQAVNTYQQNASSMSQQQQATRQEELATMEQELRELQQSIQQQIQQRRSELMVPIYNRMDKAIAEVAQANGLDFVLNEATGYGETIIYYAADEKLNITQEVLKRMNSNSSSN